MMVVLNAQMRAFVQLGRRLNVRFFTWHVFSYCWT